MLRIIHAADLHLDSPFEALGGSKAAQRRSEQRELLGRIVRLAGERQADLLLLSGDLFDSVSAYSETASSVALELGKAACPVFIAPGNHDFYSRSSPWAKLSLPENVHVFSSPRLECVELPEKGVRVWGAAFCDITAPCLLQKIDKKPGYMDICCLHGEVTELGGRYCPIPSEAVAESGMDYLALGHIHTQSGLLRAGSTYYAWPGCPEGRGFDECGEKGVYCVTLEPGNAELEFIPTAFRRYCEVSVDVSALGGFIPPQGSENDIFRILITGEADEPPELSAIQSRLEGSFFSLQLRDRTTLRRDVWESAAQDTLRGTFLRRMREKYDAAGDDAEREKITQAVRWGLAALEGGEAVHTL